LLETFWNFKSNPEKIFVAILGKEITMTSEPTPAIVLYLHSGIEWKR
jgi:hypothetical protein